MKSDLTLFAEGNAICRPRMLACFDYPNNAELSAAECIHRQIKPAPSRVLLVAAHTT
jgi:hypothetical protein